MFIEAVDEPIGCRLRSHVILFQLEERCGRDRRASPKFDELVRARTQYQLVMVRVELGLRYGVVFKTVWGVAGLLKLLVPTGPASVVWGVPRLLLGKSPVLHTFW